MDRLLQVNLRVLELHSGPVEVSTGMLRFLADIYGFWQDLSIRMNTQTSKSESTRPEPRMSLNRNHRAGFRAEARICLRQNFDAYEKRTARTGRQRRRRRRNRRNPRKSRRPGASFRAAYCLF